jgi:ADP-ribose pyrophosphatase
MHPSPTPLFQTPWLGLFRIGTWDFVRRPHSDACVGILAITDEQEIVLVEQFRIPMGKRVIEVPAGIVGDEAEHAHQSPIEVAHRELIEETGFHAASIVPLIDSPTSAGLTSEIVHLFHATGLTRVADGGGVSGENITTHLVPLANLRPWLAAKRAEGLLVDFKIHAALAEAGISL